MKFAPHDAQWRMPVSRNRVCVRRVSPNDPLARRVAVAASRFRCARSQERAHSFRDGPPQAPMAKPHRIPHKCDDKGHTAVYRHFVKTFRWNQEKNAELKRNRRISFEDVILAIDSGGLLDVVEHPNRRRYPNQAVFVVVVAGYVHLVPFVEEPEYLFLKTIIPSRKATREYGIRGKP